jgi:hypothetical protein
MTETDFVLKIKKASQNISALVLPIDEKGYRCVYCRHHFGLVSFGPFEARVYS